MGLKNFTLQELQAFSDEDKFTLEVVIPLFETVIEANDLKKYGAAVVLYWGKDKREEGENGIDVMLAYYDHYGQVKHTGILIKIVDITMGTGTTKHSSLVNIENQLNIAWTADFFSPIDPKKACRVDDLIVITNRGINQPALRYLNKMNREKYRSVTCWDGARVESLVKRYYMEDKRA